MTCTVTTSVFDTLVQKPLPWGSRLHTTPQALKFTYVLPAGPDLLKEHILRQDFCG